MVYFASYIWLVYNRYSFIDQSAKVVGCTSSNVKTCKFFLPITSYCLENTCILNFFGKKFLFVNSVGGRLQFSKNSLSPRYNIQFTSQISHLEGFSLQTKRQKHNVLNGRGGWMSTVTFVKCLGGKWFKIARYFLHQM